MVVEYVVQSLLILRWRRWMSARYIGRWLDKGIHYRMALGGGALDNPDQRIAEDVYRFIDGGGVGDGLYSYTILLISRVSSLVSFSVILWNIPIAITFPGTNLVIPGFLFWIALVYEITGTLITHKIGRPLAGLFFVRQKFEANFRFLLARLREYAEQIAFLSGEAHERGAVLGRLEAVLGNYRAIIARQKILMAFTSFYGQISPIIPYVLTAPFYFSGTITLGLMTQAASAFDKVDSGLSFFVEYYRSLADFRSVLERLSSFDAMIDEARDSSAGPVVITSSAPQVALNDLSLTLADQRVILAPTTLILCEGESVFLSGPSGSGKSTLFRALAGLWPWGTGAIALPEGKQRMFMPQKPYLPAGSLRHACAFPALVEDMAEGQIEEALEVVGLSALLPRLDSDENWGQTLSGGEQQRLSLARILIARPDWVFLDEATSALDEESEKKILAELMQRLPTTTWVSISHNTVLAGLYKRILEMRPATGGGFTPQDAG
jgi:putative ATP-binding cassette transporter